jgi:hypothetical protein
MYSQQQPLEIPFNKLPSLGLNYESSTQIAQLVPFDFNSLMKVSEAIETDDYLPFILAVQDHCGIQNLEVVDFYFIVALLRIITLTDMPIQMNWMCRENHLRVQITGDSEISQAAVQFLIEQHFNFDSESNTWLLYSVTESQYKTFNAEITANYSEVAKGSWFTCKTENSQDLTVDHLMEFVKHYPSDMQLEQGYQTPKAIDIADYNAMGKNPALKKLRPVLMWMDESFGSTLQDRLKFMQTKPNNIVMPIVQQALKYDADYRAGISKIITCPPCSCCGARTEPYSLNITPKMFFVG